MFELHPVEGVNHSVPAALDEQMLVRVRHAVEVDLLSPDVAEWLGESRSVLGSSGERMVLLRTGRSFAEESDKILAEEIMHPNFKNKTEAIRIVKGLFRILAAANCLIGGDLS